MNPPPSNGGGEPALPGPVQDLLVRCIDSVAELEALLLLHAPPRHVWAAAAVAGRLYVDEDKARSALDRLAERGLVAAEPDGWRYVSGDETLDEAVGALANLYSRRLVAITALIHGKTARGIDEFARAFLLRRRP